MLTRRCAILLLLAGSTATAAHATADSLATRSEHRAPVQAALRGGATFTRIDYQGELEAGQQAESITGWMFGCDARRRITDLWSFESGVHVLRKGNLDRYTGPMEILGFTVQANLEAKTTLTYITIPVRIKLTTGERLQPYVRGGCDFGLLVRATSHLTGTITGNAGTAPFDQDDDVKDQVRDFEFALAMDVGVQVPLGKTSAFLEVTGSLGMTDITHSDDSSGKNQLIGLALGVVIP